MGSGLAGGSAVRMTPAVERLSVPQQHMGVDRDCCKLRKWFANIFFCQSYCAKPHHEDKLVAETGFARKAMQDCQPLMGDEENKANALQGEESNPLVLAHAADVNEDIQEPHASKQLWHKESLNMSDCSLVLCVSLKAAKKATAPL